MHLTHIVGLLAAAITVLAAPKDPKPTQNWFPDECDIYACGYCHWYYDKKHWNQTTGTLIWPDGKPAEDCINKETERWIEPCSFCKKQSYCQGDCIPKK